MSRLEEVEARLAHTVDSGWPSSDAAAEYRHLSRTLAAEVDALTEENIRLDRKRFENVTYARKFLSQLRAAKAEVDELRAKLDDVRMGIGCARGQRSTQYCAEAAQRDDVITKLLDLTAPHVDEFGNRQWWQYKRPEQMHARACEIAGRAE